MSRRKENAENRIKSLAGKILYRDKRKTQGFEITGRVIHHRGPRQYHWRPELKCLTCGYLIACPQGGNREIRPPMHPCVRCLERWCGGLYERWLTASQLASTYGIGLIEWFKKRDEQSNKGLVCCAICGLPENERRHALDHDGRFTKKSGKGNRSFLCLGCNYFLVPTAEKIISENFVQPRANSSLGYQLLRRAINYVKKWDKKLGNLR